MPWFPVIGFLLGLLMWLLDALVDVNFIQPGERLLDALWTRESTELWMRTLVVIMMTASSMFAQYFLRKHQQYEAVLLRHQEELEELVAARTQELVRMASIDPLTQLFNRRKWTELAEAELQRAQRYQQPLSLLMCDIDHFKRVNDTCGHEEGDRVL